MDYNDISATDAEELLDSMNVTVLDMRDRVAYETAHIPGALHADEPCVKMLEQNPDKQLPVLIYCYHGITSRELANYVSALGYPNVYNLNGGWQEWSQLMVNRLPQALYQWLLENGYSGINLEETNRDGLRPLMLAAREGEFHFLVELIELEVHINARNEFGYTALWYACLSSEIKIINFLIRSGVDVNQTNDTGSTPLIYTSITGNMDAMLALIEAGADLNAQTNEGYNALEMAGTLEILKVLKPFYHLQFQQMH